MTVAREVGSLWRNPDEGVTFSGWITLPYSLPGGAKLWAVLIPQPLRRSPKEKFILHIEIPCEVPPGPPGPDDINCDKGGGRTMSQFFGPARPPGRRIKAMFMGGSGTGKTLSALGFPRCAYIDNHRSAENYQAAYPQHLYFPKLGQVVTVDSTTEAIKSLLVDPGDRLTVVVDDITTYNDQIDFKWNNLFFKRQPGSKGHHKEYYSNQPNDYIHPKREKNALIRRLLALDLNVIVIARMKKEYAGSAGGADFMKVIGETFAGDPNLVYEFDYIFKFVNEDEGRFAEIKLKQRVPVGGKPFPVRFPFLISDEGRSNFFDIFKEHALSESFEAAAETVKDPVTETDIGGPVQEPHPPKVSADTQQSAVQPEKIVAAGDVDPALAEKVSAAANVTQPAPDPTLGPTDPITSTQLDKLVVLKKQFNIQKEEWDKTLQKSYNATTARALTQEQGDHFINYLEKVRVPF